MDRKTIEDHDVEAPPYSSHIDSANDIESSVRTSDSNTDQHVNIEDEGDQGQEWSGSSELPEYTEVQDDRIAPPALDEPRNTDLEGCRQQTMTPTTAEDSLASIIETAIADVSNRKTASDSPYYIPRQNMETFRQRLVTAVCDGSFSDVFRILEVDTGAGQPLDEERWSQAMKRISLMNAFFTAISRGANELISKLLDSNLVDANTGRSSGYMYGKIWETPLSAAVKAKRHRTVRLLLEHGALVDDWVIVDSFRLRTSLNKHTCYYVLRTPLQIAAQQGSLPIVRLLIDNFHADDSIVSPGDGQTALRIAADARHKDIVAYLPARRGGAKLRWQLKWRKSKSTIYKNTARIAEILYAVFISCPKWIFEEVVVSLVKCVWKALPGFPNWLMRTIRKIPAFLISLPGKMLELGKAIGEWLLEICKSIAQLCRTIVGSIYKAICNIVNRAMALLHTAIVAVVTFFRELTWIDIWHGFQDLLHAIFISFPRALCHMAVKAWLKIYDILALMCGCVGICIWCVVTVLSYVVVAVAEKGMICLGAIGGALSHPFKEVIIWWNPKAM